MTYSGSTFAILKNQNLKTMSEQYNGREDDINDNSSVEDIEVNLEESTDEKYEEEQPSGNEEIEKLQDDLGRERDKFIRLFAEFENYKKRTIRERTELFKTAGEEIIQALLPVLDDFDRAYVEISKTNEKSLLKGVELISHKLRETLRQKGLSQMEVVQGEPFNPDTHEAVTQIPAPSPELKGKIIDVIEKGYKLGEKIIRFPKVVIGQ